MPSVNTIKPQTKNSMPTFIHATYDNLIKGLNDNKVQPPIFGFCSDLECMIYVAPDGRIYKILVDRVTEIEKQLEGLKDPETGKPVKVTEYVETQLDPVQTQVDEIKENLGTINIVV